MHASIGISCPSGLGPPSGVNCVIFSSLSVCVCNTEAFFGGGEATGEGR